MERTMSASAYGIAKRHKHLKTTLLHGRMGLIPHKSLRCDVVFGSPSVGCRGTGICKLNADDGVKAAAKEETCRNATALLLAHDDGEGVALILPRAFLCINILRRHLRHHQLHMDEPCQIPRDIVAALGLKIKSLPPGLHAVEDLDTYYRIDFRIP